MTVEYSHLAALFIVRLPRNTYFGIGDEDTRVQTIPDGQKVHLRIDDTDVVVMGNGRVSLLADGQTQPVEFDLSQDGVDHLRIDAVKNRRRHLHLFTYTPAA